MIQAIPTYPTPLPLGICLFLFFLEKLQIPNGGAGRFIQKPHGGAQKKWADAPPRANTNIAFSSK